MRVLFVDEEWDIEITVKALRNRYPEDEFCLADRLRDAKAELWSRVFDVVVLDIMMPSDDSAVPNSSDEGGLVSGLLLYKMVRSDPQCPNVGSCFLLLTGVMPEVHPAIANAQVEFGDRFLRKPIHPERLFSAIQDFSKQ